MQKSLKYQNVNYSAKVDDKDYLQINETSFIKKNNDWYIYSEEENCRLSSTIVKMEQLEIKLSESHRLINIACLLNMESDVVREGSNLRPCNVVYSGLDVHDKPIDSNILKIIAQFNTSPAFNQIGSGIYYVLETPNHKRYIDNSQNLSKAYRNYPLYILANYCIDRSSEFNKHYQEISLWYIGNVLPRLLGNDIKDTDSSIYVKTEFYDYVYHNRQFYERPNQRTRLERILCRLGYNFPNGESRDYWKLMDTEIIAYDDMTNIESKSDQLKDIFIGSEIGHSGNKLYPCRVIGNSLKQQNIKINSEIAFFLGYYLPPYFVILTEHGLFQYRIDDYNWNKGILVLDEPVEFSFNHLALKELAIKLIGKNKEILKEFNLRHRNSHIPLKDIIKNKTS